MGSCVSLVLLEGIHGRVSQRVLSSVLASPLACNYTAAQRGETRHTHVQRTESATPHELASPPLVPRTYFSHAGHFPGPDFEVTCY